jgi:hypothetical protein
MSAYEIEPANKEVHTMLEKLQNNMRNYKVKEKEVYRAMASNTTVEQEDVDPQALPQESEKLEVADDSVVIDSAEAIIEPSADHGDGEKNGRHEVVSPADEEKDRYSPSVEREADEAADDDDDEEAAQLASQKKLVDGIFMLAVALGVVALVLVPYLLFAGDGSESSGGSARAPQGEL